MTTDHGRLSEEELAGMRVRADVPYADSPDSQEGWSDRRRLLAHEAELRAGNELLREARRRAEKAELEAAAEADELRAELATAKAERAQIDEACRKLGLWSLLLQIEPTATGASAAVCQHGSSGACQQCDLADLSSFASPPATGAAPALSDCLDCGMPYGGEDWLDCLLPRWQWLEINPDDGGILCANCMVKRASKLPGAVGFHAVIGISPPRAAPAKVCDHKCMIEQEEHSTCECDCGATWVRGTRYGAAPPEAKGGSTK